MASYLIARVTRLLWLAPPIRALTRIVLPSKPSVGILTFNCHTPINPGANPEYCISAKTAPPPEPPNATQTAGCLLRQVDASEVGAATVLSRAEGAFWPSGTGETTGPWPVPNNCTTVPRGAGWEGLLIELS